MNRSTATVVSAVIVALEALAVMILAGMQVVALTTGDVMTVSSSIALIVLTIVMGFGLLAFAWGIWQNQTWGRSGGIVMQLMILAIAIGSATGQFAHPLVGVGIAIPAVIALIAIMMASRKIARAEAAERAEAERLQAEADAEIRARAEAKAAKNAAAKRDKKKR